MNFFQAVKKYREIFGLPAGRAPKKGSQEYDDVMGYILGKKSKSYSAYEKKQLARIKKGEEDEASESRQQEEEDRKHTADIRRRARKGLLTPVQLRMFKDAGIL